MRRGPRLAAALLIITLVGWFVARSGFVFSGEYGPSALVGLPAVVAVTAMAGLAALMFLIAARRLSSRVTCWVVAVQALLAFGPYFVVGGVWGPVAGGVVAAMLFAMPRRVSWPLSVSVIALDIGLSAVFQEPGIGGLALVGRLVIDVLGVLHLFGVVLLTDLTRRVAAERTAHTALAVAKERLDNAERMRTALGTDLSVVLRLSRRDVDDQDVRTRLTEIATHARRAARTARSIIDTRREVPRQPTGLDTARTTMISPRLAWSFTVATTIGCALLVLVNLAYYTKPTTTGWVLGVLVLGVSSALQMYHGAPRVGDHAARWWPWTLPFHLVILMATLPLAGPYFTPSIALAAGAVLYRFPAPWSFGVVPIMLVGLQLVLPPGATLGDRVYFVAGLTASLIPVYAYCRLPEVTRALVQARDGLARLAVVRERLRITRDVHDLFGFSITGISLKCELITRLVDTDSARARHEIAELRRLAERGLAEVRAMTSGTPELDLAEELRTARSLLDAAGIQTEVALDAPAMPADIATLLATVAREAVTNVIRHAAASICQISLTMPDGAVRLRVANDGRTGSATSERAGTGLANLGARLASAGGQLDTEPDGDRFVLTARIPLRGRLQPARLGRDPDRVDPVPGVELGHR